MNVKLLRKVAKHILAEPKRFVMWTWMREKGAGAYDFTSDASDNRPVPFAKCGTAACIAGWTCILSGDSSPRDFETRAADLLNINDTKAKRLFLLDMWPVKFRAPYRKAVSQRAFVKIAANRIEHFIKTGE